MAEDQLALFEVTPNRRQIRMALVVAGALLTGDLVVFGMGDMRLRQLDAFVPTVDAILFVTDLITATLLFAQAAVFRKPALLALAAGYLFTAVLIMFHALTFPGAFAPSGMLGTGISTTPWIAVFWRAGFPIAIIAYRLLQSDNAPSLRRPPRAVAVSIVSAVAMGLAFALLATVGENLLPPLMISARDFNDTHIFIVNGTLSGLCLLALLALLRRRISALDVLLLLSLWAWLNHLVLIGATQGRFTPAWYFAYVSALVAHLVVTLALLAETSRIYARLILSSQAHHRERENRLLSVDAVASAIAHEVRQPLAAMALNATAAMEWLANAPDDQAAITKPLRAIVEDSRRTAHMIEGIRAILAKQTGNRTAFSVNELVRETSSLMARDLAREKVRLELALHEPLPPIFADRIQIQQVLVNLLTNAIESLQVVRDGKRKLSIRTATTDGQEVLLEVTDTGAGIRPEQMIHIFEAFFTTKASGSGLGLSLCRSIVETHGGALWASNGAETGSTFHLQLPCVAP